MSVKVNAYQPVSLGTTIIGVIYDGGVILGADSRTSSGSLVSNRCTNKVRMLSDKIGCCTAGDAAHSETIVDYTRHSLRMYTSQTGEEPCVQAAATSYKNLVYSNKSFLSCSGIIGGYDDIKGGSIYRVLQSGAIVPGEMCLGGSGSTYIYGFCDANFRKNMTLQQAKQFVITAISLAIARDGSSGGNIHTVVINKESVTSEWITGDKVPAPEI
ncbi:proteasome subunit beta type-6 precursor, putative [Entamoeba invadens IP1]|uniref:proteasome endopeptidase complex n=1 Tax=Entamoeba invadens IP1 TaxID=370355 RepID=A0A0A1UEG5_ENTIV|nr:proteasome subunit beta type-6 precursor, putative [Entamoeba invadens IP1]ELP92186.1 proteasome subunit beta type-6 precursor, putative [Entamoeba invadens IP1]|eukprot:XP_004258957.1 proteasome subunit beta type-6 precursor, putative [Entamoeba invadens IP1]